ncbi:MAG: zf-HC2 domain-containing protein [Planctomycetes bacterium]|nr:zf-HC2 domain-containing protein [Planctomycetota bacterium]
MNCRQVTPLFSELLERALAPVIQERVSAHLAACPACRRELEDLRTALRALRATGRDEPPAGLLEATVARVEAAGAPPGGRPAGRAARVMRVLRSGRRALPWLLAAACLLLALALGALREAAWRARTAGLEGRLSDSDAERRRLERGLDGLRSGQDALRRELAEARDASGAARKACEEEAAKLREEARLQTEEVAALRTALARREGDARLAAAEVEELRMAMSAASRHEPEPPGEPPAREPEPAPEAEPAVVFRGNGGRMDLEVRGSREQVIPELLRIAADEGAPQMSDLALATLEGLLGRERAAAPQAGEGPAASEEGGGGVLGLWRRGVEGVTGLMGLGEGEPEPQAATPDRRRKLSALEKLWEMESRKTTE